MKEQLYTIPLMDAFRANDECPFCYITRNVEQDALDFALGPEASYMREDIREETDKIGFCKEHYHKMFAYGEALGCSLILDTHLKKLRAQMKKEMNSFSSIGKVSLSHRFQKNRAGLRGSSNLSQWIRKNEESCYICNHIQRNYDRYLATFFVLFKRGEQEFVELVKNGKGLCLSHLADVLDAAPLYLNEKEQKELRNILFPQMEENLNRIQEELDWFEKKFDYRYQNEDWKNSRDAVQRAMQKIGSGYPADPPYRQK